MTLMTSPIRSEHLVLGGLTVLLATATPSCIIRTQADIEAREQAKNEAAAEAARVEQKEEPVFDGETGPAQPVRATILLDSRYQALEGFGASVAWYHDRIVGNVDEGTYETLFPELGLDILRYRNRFEREQEEADIAQEVEI